MQSSTIIIIDYSLFVLAEFGGQREEEVVRETERNCFGGVQVPFRISQATAKRFVDPSHDSRISQVEDRSSLLSDLEV